MGETWDVMEVSWILISLISKTMVALILKNHIHILEKMELVLIIKIMSEQQSILVLILNHKMKKHFNKQLLILDQSQLLLMLIFVHSNFTRMAFITIECAHQQNLIMASLLLDMI